MFTQALDFGETITAVSATGFTVSSTLAAGDYYINWIACVPS